VLRLYQRIAQLQGDFYSLYTGLSGKDIFHRFATMQIPSEILKSVVFLYSQNRAGDPAAIGTAFLLSYDLGEEIGRLVYSVTARHVIKNADVDGNDGHCHFRFNVIGGGVEWVAIPFSQWFFPDDIRVDLAIAPVRFDRAKLDHKHVPHTMLITDDVIEDYLVGVGEELFFPGLFVEHQGESSNAPIMRIGNIAAMPGEHVMTRGDIAARVYLVEARSIGGLSGSPVFIDIGKQRQRKDNMVISGGSHFKLLGSVKGHFDERGRVGPKDDIHIGSGVVERINMGIALVVPASDISVLLAQADVAAHRKVVLQDALANEGGGF
jgi:hypothetical protein